MIAVVSIIVPCFNQAQYLPDALESVLLQTYANWECIIVNDGSPDNTKEVAQEWCAKDDRFKYIEKKNGGLSSARNAGIAASHGKYILPLDADDKISPDYLEQGVKVLEHDELVALVYGKAMYFGDMQGEWNLPSYTLEGLALSNMIYCSAIFRREDFDKYGPYDESLKKGLEDWDLWISILKNGGEVFHLSNVCFHYRKRKERSMMDEMKNKILLNDTLRYIYNKHEEFYFKQFGNPISLRGEKVRLKRELEIEKASLERLKQSKAYKIGSFLKNKLGI